MRKKTHSLKNQNTQKTTTNEILKQRYRAEKKSNHWKSDRYAWCVHWSRQLKRCTIVITIIFIHIIPRLPSALNYFSSLRIDEIQFPTISLITAYRYTHIFISFALLSHSYREWKRLTKMHTGSSAHYTNILLPCPMCSVTESGAISASHLIIVLGLCLCACVCGMHNSIAFEKCTNNKQRSTERMHVFHCNVPVTDVFVPVVRLFIHMNFQLYVCLLYILFRIHVRNTCPYSRRW